MGFPTFWLLLYNYYYHHSSITKGRFRAFKAFQALGLWGLFRALGLVGFRAEGFSRPKHG